MKNEIENQSEIEKEEFSSKEVFLYKLDIYLHDNYTKDVIELIKEKIQTGSNSTKYQDKNIKSYVQRQLKNIHNKEERQKNKLKMQSKGVGTLDSRRYEKSEEETIFDRKLYLWCRYTACCCTNF